MPTVSCHVCHASFDRRDTVGPAGIHRSVLARITETAGGPPGEDARICRRCFFTARTASLIDRLARQRGTLTAIERDLAAKASEHETVAANIDAEFESKATLADRAADMVARLGGTWTFVGAMCLAIAVWTLVNSRAGTAAVDPFPYILLNLVLSCVAALQAPVLLMSANRQTAHDRRKANQDFLVNLKAEIEVASLHEKLDHLLHVQWDELLEMQELQIEMLETVVGRKTR